ncbi:alpha/beta fold hydrolase [Chamaesiphon polymorphus]|uniref:Sigma factor SigB regulation protein RsbQ n=1 Tax=Chamaesiphon polymorphus CCALA 037 TaxID=2107692 RepID=A0A2T1F514_9CYAN|nr:alpha/beta hydrolase [Chamaesiphon polymorphus]PSB40081.1 sigma factor SigB regulation protein RsbQ [Chamaesiphon polymorphus CCALA 037]
MPQDILKRNNVRSFGRGSQPMMFAHGFGGNQQMWHRITPAFEENYRIVLFDHMGSGKSDLGAYDPDRYGELKSFALDVVEICEALNLSDVILVGHSVGATIGMLASIYAPQILAQLILVCPSPCYLNEGDYQGGFERSDIDGLIDLMDKNYIGWASYLAPLAMKNEDFPEFTLELESSFLNTDRSIANQFAKVTFYADSRKFLPQVSVLSLILQSTDDIFAAPEIGVYMQQHLRNSTLKNLEANGHFPHISNPSEFIVVLNEYLTASLIS